MIVDVRGSKDIEALISSVAGDANGVRIARNSNGILRLSLRQRDKAHADLVGLSSDVFVYSVNVVRALGGNLVGMDIYINSGTQKRYDQYIIEYPGAIEMAQLIQCLVAPLASIVGGSETIITARKDKTLTVTTRSQAGGTLTVDLTSVGNGRNGLIITHGVGSDVWRLPDGQDLPNDLPHVDVE